MKAIVYHAYGGPEVLQLAERSRPQPGPGQVVVRVETSSINAADYRMMRADPFLVRLMNGLWRPVKRQVLGQDMAGVVVEVGAGVKRFTLGDRVFGEALEGGEGAFAEYAVTDECSLAQLPAGLRFDEAGAVPLAGITALQAVRDAGAVTARSRVLIAGAGGGVGLFAVQIAKVLGAHVTATCGAGSLEVAKSLGADEVIDYTRHDLRTLSQQWDTIIAINGYQSLATYSRRLAPGGHYVMVGGTSGQLFEALLFARPYFALSRKHGVALTINPSTRTTDLAQLSQWLGQGLLRVVVDQRYSLAQTADAMAHAERGHVRGKIIISMQREEGVLVPRRSSPRDE